MQLKPQQHIRFVKIEQPRAWVVVAVLYEKQGDTLVALTEPRVIKVIPKNIKALAGEISTTTLFLASTYAPAQKNTGIVSSYFSTVFGFANIDIDITQAARPPTYT